MKKAIYILCSLLISFAYLAQSQSYTLQKLNQEPIQRGQIPTVLPTPKESGDTSFTVYQNCSIPMELYFVNGANYHPVLNPNPTGLYLNKQHFLFFCDIEKAFRQSVSTILDVYEFTYLNRKYLCTFTLREDKATSKYKCYNLFDMTNPNKIVQVSFSSIHQGDDSFGDYNMDGIIDFVRAQSAKTPPGANRKVAKPSPDTYLITAYTFLDGKIKQLNNASGTPHYIFAKGDENLDGFQPLQHDWMIPLNDSTGKQLKTVSYHNNLEKFDAKEGSLYTPIGSPVEKNRWSVLINLYDEEGGAQTLCEDLKQHELGELYIMLDQYGNSIKWQVLMGNFTTKEQAEITLNKLQRYGFRNAKLRDFKTSY